jgi:hypothetical protein
MTRSKRVLAIVAVLLVAASVLAAQTKPGPKTVTVTAGDDAWTTVGGGKMVVSLADYPIAKVFGAKYKATSVSLKGKPLSPELGNADTIVKRGKDIVLKGGKGSGPLEIVALSLESEKPVSIGGKNYQLHVGLSETKKEGHISLTSNGKDGGTFSASLPVVPKLVFTPEGGGQAMTIDCGAVPCGKGGKGFVFTDTKFPWAISGGARKVDAAALHITPLKAGVRVGGEGSPEYTTVGSSNFLPGVSTAGAAARKIGGLSTGIHPIIFMQ